MAVLWDVFYKKVKIIKVLRAEYIFSLFFLLTACNNVEKEKGANATNTKDKVVPKLFTTLGTRATGVHFRNNLPETVEMNGLLYEYYYNGAGVSLGDFNNDGLDDIFFVSNLSEHQLYINQGGLKFKNVGISANLTDQTGFPTGSTVVDINNDGKLDIYVCKSGKYKDPKLRKNTLYINQGNDEKGYPKFKEAAAQYNLDLPYCSTQASFFDYDKDGDLDMFLINHDPNTYGDEDIEKYQKSKGIISGERLYKNNNGKFEDVTERAGIINNKLGFGLGVGIGDLNNDSWPDIYVSNDFSGKDHLYINQQDGTFSEEINNATNQISFFSMGNDISDYNNDGLLDIISVDMSSEDNYSTKTSMSGMNPARFWDLVSLGEHHQYMYNTLQLNNGVASGESLPRFSNMAQMAGISSTDWSWGPLFMDMDNDGFKDLFVSNGIKRDFRNNDFVNYHKKVQAEVLRTKKINKTDYIKEVLPKMPTRQKENYFFRNNGDLTFEKKNSVWVDSLVTVSNGAAYGDLDNDGDLDLVVNNMDNVALIYKNNTEKQKKSNYLKIRFKGSDYNSLGIGARVIVKTNGQTQIQEHYLTRGFQSSVSPGLHFGLGENDIIDEIKVVWFDNKYQVLKKVKPNQVLTLKYEEAEREQEEKGRDGKYFVNATSKTLQYGHKENVYNDFEKESLLPHKMSQQGPAFAVGDINGDGIDDFYLGGAMGYSGSIFIQNSDGTFTSEKHQAFKNDKLYEDVGATLFDADNDGDLDLYVVSGGNERDQNSKYYQDRFYENQNGTFLRNFSAIPEFFTSGSCVKSFDYDGDGDLDLFVGGRQTPGKYPYPTDSYLLENKTSGSSIHLVDVSNTVIPDLKGLGMVTDAAWADIDGDSLTDLIVVGEWMPIKVFKNKGSHFVDHSKEYGVNEEVGWWNSISVNDYDNDGDLDFVCGNLGLNYKYKANKEETFDIYAKDFDESGNLDIVLGYYNEGDLFPLRGRECSSNQMPFIKKKFESYDAFGKATLVEVYGTENLKNSIHYKARNFSNTYFENLGRNSKMAISPLNAQAQVSSINTVLSHDFNKDGFMDILVGGNLYGSEVETPRNDASYGLLCLKTSNGLSAFKPLASSKTGLYVNGEVKHIELLKGENGKHKIVFVRNNNDLVFYALNNE